MLPYLILLFVVVGLALLGHRYASVGIQRFNIVLVSALLIFFAGFRHYSVGTDTRNYVSWLSIITSLEEAMEFHVELGFNILVFISSSLSDGYAVFLSLIAVLVIGCYITTVVRIVKNYEFAFFVFITLGAYTFFFNGARQGLAVALCFFALPWLLERKMISYFFVISAAALFHKTAIIAAPIYFLARARVGVRDIIFTLIFGTAILTFLMPSFTQYAASLIDERYAVYGRVNDGGGYVNLAFLITQGMLFILFKFQINEYKDWYCRLLNLYFIGMAFGVASVVASVNPSGVSRLTIYFSHVSIILWPMVLSSYRSRTNKNIFLLVFSFFAILYFTLTTLSFSGLVPYRLNSSLFL
ncbi:EpsG family protein [Halomonas alimentaria]|uniref:EpsG family protein n=1 Tax=Halomonas alimentaria TaxID=147248 RepID=UPI0024934F99|nr:EpsG family protein [Halomonas alimentaria]